MRPNGERERLSMLSTLRPWLVFRAQNLCRGGADAEDLVQEVLVKFVDSFPQMAQPAPEHVCMAWMATTLHHTFISRLRKERVRQSMEPALVHLQSMAQDLASPTEFPFSERIADDDLREAIESLSLKLRVAFEASREGKSYAQIGQELGIKEGAVAKRIFDARKGLKRFLSARLGRRSTES